MQIGPYKFDRLELAGSMGDLGTIIPLSVALILITGVSVTTVLLTVGLFYVAAGFYFKLPIPVQPLKVVSAIAIAFPGKVTLSILAAAGISFGLILLLLALTGLIDRISKFFTRPIIRGIQVGLGFLLINKGIALIIKPELFINPVTAAGFSQLVNPAIGIAGFIVALCLLTNKKFPAALVLVVAGVAAGMLLGSLRTATFAIGPTPISLPTLTPGDFTTALILLVIPQIPLTLGNAVIGTTDTCLTLFGRNQTTQRVSNRAFSVSMGLANLGTGLLGGIPMCHGSGGLAAHYRFGARTGGSNIMIGVIFLIVALGFGQMGIALLSSIPNGILGVLLLFAGLELALLVRDVSGKKDLFLTFLVAGIGLATTNMGIAFIIGILTQGLIKWRRIKL
ncbi:MAG: sulfate permease [Desulfobacterales bacterium]|nr:sulfate permease [Desulfobacterales bacterium]